MQHYTTQLHGVKDGNMLHRQTTLIERPGTSPATGNCEITSKPITDVRTRGAVTRTSEEQKLLGLRPMQTSPPSGAPSQPIDDDIIDGEVDQSQIRGKIERNAGRTVAH